MIVYRISLPHYAGDLSGTGASLFGGRWNTIGRFVVYTAETSSLSILEHLVHMKGTHQNPEYLLSTINLFDSPIEILESQLIDTKNHSLTQKIGNDWLARANSPILKVPSVVNPLESNFLINPTHPELSISIENQDWFVYDDRLIHKNQI